MLENLAMNAERINAEQESLKSQMKQKTAELHEKEAELNAETQKLRKLIKAVCSKADWNSFGILDKK